MEDWFKYNFSFFNYNVGEFMEIIEDALSMGFEFKVENHALYFREIL